MVDYLLSPGMFVQAALACYVLGLMTRDELVLRVLILMGTCFYGLYYSSIGPQPLWDAMLGSVLIGSVNVWIIAVILRERSTLGMQPADMQLFQTFATFTPGQYRRLMARADVRTAARDETICTQGIRPSALFLIADGRAKLIREGRESWIDAGHFVGEISFVLGGPATGTVIAPAGTRYVVWERRGLRDCLRRSPGLSNALNALLNRDISKKLANSHPG